MVLYGDESYAIMGAVFEVYKTLGNSFTEHFYQKALEHEFKLRKIPFESQKTIPAKYKGVEIGFFRPDFVCYDKIVVEIKSISQTAEEEVRQVLIYLDAGDYDLGILVNFGSEKHVSYQRIIRKGSSE